MIFSNGYATLQALPRPIFVVKFDGSSARADPHPPANPRVPGAPTATRYLAPEAGYELPGTGPVIGNVTCMPLQPRYLPYPPVQTATLLQCNEINALCDDQNATPKSDVAD